jgi:hypothetical protein
MLQVGSATFRADDREHISEAFRAHGGYQPPTAPSRSQARPLLSEGRSGHQNDVQSFTSVHFMHRREKRPFYNV